MRVFIILLPWLELFTLISLGIETSALTALGYVFCTGVLGLLILQRQGRELVQRMRQDLEGAPSGFPGLLLDDMALGFAGMLMMIPGMITDLLALVVLVGPLRRRLALLLGGAQPQPRAGPQGPGGDSAGPQTIEGTFHRVDEDLKP